MPFKYLVFEGRFSWMVRIFHCCITIGVIGSLLFTNSVLYNIFHNRTDLYYGILFLIIHFISIILYIFVSYMDPGYATSKLNIAIWEDDTSPSEESELNGTVEGNDSDVHPMIGKSLKNQLKPNKKSVILNRYCFICNFEQPLRCKHCNDCQKCVLKYDHHCPWIDNCIGENNHPVFLIFLILELIGLLWTLYWSWISITSSLQWLLWLKINIFYLLNIVICILGGIPLICLLIFHLYLAFTNSTTWETAARDKITYLKKFRFNFNPFHQGYLRNLAQFCCRFEYPKKWEVIYHRNCQKLDDEDKVDDDDDDDSDEEEDSGSGRGEAHINFKIIPESKGGGRHHLQ